MRSGWPFAHFGTGGFHGFAVQCGGYGCIHHQLGEAARGLIQRFGRSAQRIEVAGIAHNLKLGDQLANLRALLFGQLPPRRMARRFGYGGQYRGCLVTCLDELTLLKIRLGVIEGVQDHRLDLFVG